MKVFRVYSDAEPDGMFLDWLIKSVNVLAENKDQAKEIVKKENLNFVCDIEDVKVEIISDVKKPMVLSRENYDPPL